MPGQVNEGRPATNVQHRQAEVYVDDVNVVTKATFDEALNQKLEQDYKALNSYLINHLMVVNTAETQLMMITPPP